MGIERVPLGAGLLLVFSGYLLIGALTGGRRAKDPEIKRRTETLRLWLYRLSGICLVVAVVLFALDV